jgi:hypothetical protein
MNDSSKLTLFVCLAFGGCVAAEPSLDTGDPATDTTEQEVGSPQVHVVDNRGFGGNLFAENFLYVIGSNCSSGYVRSGTPGAQWTSQMGGSCGFQGWFTPENPHDCRARILAHTGGGFFGGTCLSWVYEELEPTSFSYSATNTSSAQINTANRTILLGAGQTLTIGTCGVTNSSFSGDTYLRLNDPWGAQVASNDDACALGSRFVYTATSSGAFEIHAGCYSNTSCAGTVAWTIQ